MLAIPTFFDLIATVLMNIGLLSVTASVYQMMRGAEMLFAALFSVSFLHRSLNRFHLMGILCCVVGALADSLDAQHRCCYVHICVSIPSGITCCLYCEACTQ